MPLPLIPLALSGASFLGGLFGNRPKTSNSSYNNTSTQTSALSPQASGLNDQILEMIRGRLSSPSALPTGYQERGIQDINRVFALTDQNRNANLTARGLSTSPVAAIDSNAARAGEIAKFQTGLPLVERDLRNQDMDFASRLFALQPRTTTTTSSGTGTQTQPGNMLGGGLDSLGAMLGLLMGQGAFGGLGGGGRTAQNPLGIRGY